MNQYEFDLEDRIAKIQSISAEYDLLNNAYISFSGGKDSTILHYLIDIALPNNKIPRVFINTGIEYFDIVNFVKELAKTDDRILIINSGVNIHNMLKENGMPFKSKQHSHNLSIFNNNKEECRYYIKLIESKPELKDNFDFIHNLPLGVKTIVKYYFGIRERERESCMSLKGCPSKLKYQFAEDLKFNISDLCCYKLKKEVAKKWQEENNKTITMTGIRAEEGGMRGQGGCAVFEDDKLIKFHPLKIVNENWEKWFIDKYNIKLCKLYYPPYNFKRTGCKGCPFALDLNEQLDKMEKYLPAEYKQCEFIWKPVYDEYRRINYRLKKNKQLKMF